MSPRGGYRPGAGRPEGRTTHPVSTHVPLWVYEHLEKRAKEEGVSLYAVVAADLEEAARKRGARPPIEVTPREGPHYSYLFWAWTVALVGPEIKVHCGSCKQATSLLYYLTEDKHGALDTTKCMDQECREPILPREILQELRSLHERRAADKAFVEYAVAKGLWRGTQEPPRGVRG